MRKTLLTKTIADAPEWYKQSTLRNFERMTFENDSDFMEWLEEVKEASDNVGDNPEDEKTEEYYRNLFTESQDKKGAADLDQNDSEDGTQGAIDLGL